MDPMSTASINRQVGLQRWIKTSIEAALLLRHPLSPKKILEHRHGHSFSIIIGFVELNVAKKNVGCIAQHLALQIRKILDPLRRCNLNDCIDINMPTAENLGLWLKHRIVEKNFLITFIEIQDTPSSGIVITF